MKTYYLATKYKLLYSAISVIIVLLLLKLSSPNYLCFGIFSTYIIFVTAKRVIDEHIVLSEDEIEYHTIGLTFNTKWQSIKEIGTYWAAPYKQEGLFVDPSLVKLKEWRLGSYTIYRGWRQWSFIPLSRFADDWRDSELGRQIRQYAPHLFEKNP